MAIILKTSQCMNRRRTLVRAAGVACALQLVVGAEPTPAASRFDLYIVEREQSQRGVVTLHGRRGQEAISAAMPSAESSLPSLAWSASVRPQMAPSTLAAYRDGLELVAAKRPLDAAARWKQLAVASGNEGTELGVWLFHAAAKVLSDARVVPEAVSSYREAERLAMQANSTTVAAFITNVPGRVLETSKDLVGAAETYARALNLLAPLGESMFLSRALVDAGSIGYARGDLRGAEKAFEAALSIREKLSPGRASSHRCSTTWERSPKKPEPLNEAA